MMLSRISIYMVILVKGVQSLDFANCRESFLQNTPPNIKSNNSLSLCLIHKDTAYYAIEYDTEMLIPLYSAYNITHFDGKASRGESVWRSYQDIDQIYVERHNKPKTKYQAFKNDYKKIGNLTRGHLKPAMFAKESKHHMASTFYLVNIAPQYIDFNGGIWAKTEMALYNEVKKNCSQPGLVSYFVTGVIPGSYKTKTEINIPDYWWTAVCCYSSENYDEGWSRAVVGQNVPNTQSVDQMDVSNLQKELYRYMNIKVKIFHDIDVNGTEVEHCAYGKQIGKDLHELDITLETKNGQKGKVKKKRNRKEKKDGDWKKKTKRKRKI